MNETVNCPACRSTPCTKRDILQLGNEYDCPRCGKFVLCGTLANGFNDRYLTLQRSAVLSHLLRRVQRPDGTPVQIYEEDLPNFRLDDPLPSPAEQADNLILWIGDRRLPHMEFADVPAPEISAWIGAAIPTKKFPGCALTWLLSQDAVKNLVEGFGTGSPKTMEFRLYMAGWERYEALKHAQVKSRTAFMAMQFGDVEFNRVVNDCFKPSVEAAGFKLRLLTDGQPAGLIDDQLRVALRTARFVIADLTHGNNGAYWEAGFAEGLGRPVIYTCRKKEWDANKSHFDTSHLNTIIWNQENLGDAATLLTATIRATLPTEAKMTD
jgi:nucleoside 2-deoxyribosyltransferase